MSNYRGLIEYIMVHEKNGIIFSYGNYFAEKICNTEWKKKQGVTVIPPLVKNMYTYIICNFFTYKKKTDEFIPKCNTLTTVIPIWMIFVFLLVIFIFSMFVMVSVDIFINKKRKSTIKKNDLSPFMTVTKCFFPQHCW